MRMYLQITGGRSIARPRCLLLVAQVHGPLPCDKSKVTVAGIFFQIDGFLWFFWLSGICLRLVLLVVPAPVLALRGGAQGGQRGWLTVCPVVLVRREKCPSTSWRVAYSAHAGRSAGQQAPGEREGERLQEESAPGKAKRAAVRARAVNRVVQM